MVTWRRMPMWSACMVKDVAFDLNDKKYPHMQATHAWKQLVVIQQQDEEDLVDY